MRSGAGRADAATTGTSAARGEDNGAVGSRRRPSDIGEHFIPADRPIAIDLQHRRDLIEAARAEPAVVDHPPLSRTTGASR
jgi:hypothetical protein